LKLLVYSFLIIFSCLNAQTNTDWKNLFDGASLNGWNQKGGKATYYAKNNMIIGKTVANTPNSFLCTNDLFADFILEFEVLVEGDINSGVQIRSNSNTEYRDGLVHGYQVEIDPSPRAFSGGIYEEAGRGWLYPISRNKKALPAFKNGKWNHFRVEAIGNSFRTWVNGIMCNNLVDNKTASGFIGLQVHSINKKENVDKTIKWRNIRIKTENLDINRLSVDPQVTEISYLLNQLTQSEIRKGWHLLFDGKTTNGWRSNKGNYFPDQGWQIKNGVLTVLATDGGEATGPGDIITLDTYADFELQLEFKISEGANSGIKYFMNPEFYKAAGSAIGCEFQILDDKKHPDAQKGIAGNRTVGSLYDLIAAEGLSSPGRNKQFRGVGTWNVARIVSVDGHVEHWLNNEKVVEYDRFSQMFRALVAGSKYNIWKNFGQLPQGHILLQDHGDTVHYRNIKIREF